MEPINIITIETFLKEFFPKEPVRVFMPEGNSVYGFYASVSMANKFVKYCKTTTKVSRGETFLFPEELDELEPTDVEVDELD